MDKRLCAACRTFFESRPQVSRQLFCSAPACQRERRRRWQEAKRRSDPDYGENQRSAQRAWSSRNPDYWREYRRAHPEYRERNRVQQNARYRALANANVAKMDVSQATAVLRPGLYRIVPSPPKPVAKKNVWIAEITWIAELSDRIDGRCKERTR